MGTHWGVVHIMDFEGNENQKFQAHSATVNDLSVDLDGEFIASASDDGKRVYRGNQRMTKICMHRCIESS